MGYQVPSVNQCYDFTCVIGQLQAWCCSHAPLVQSVYDECKGTSLSEQVAYLFGVVRDVVKAQQCVDENFKTLYDFVKDFFENLDLQEEVNNILNEMYEDGRLAALVSSLTQTYVINVVYAGCKNDGTDISNVLQPLIQYNPNATFYFPPGSYTFYEIDAKNAKFIFDDDAVVSCPDTSKQFVLGWKDASHVSISGGSFTRGTNDKTLVPTIGDYYTGIFRFENTSYIDISNINVLYCSCYYAVMFYNCEYCNVKLSSFQHTLLSSVYIYGVCNHINIDLCKFIDALLCDNLNETYFYTYTVVVGRPSSPVINKIGSGLNITNCLFENCEWEGVDSHGMNNVVIQNNIIHNTPRFITAYYDNRYGFDGIFYGCIISNNYCYNDDDYTPPNNPGSEAGFNQRWGISTYANDPMTAHCIEISNNTLINAVVSGSQTSGVIRVQRCKDVVIKNNYCLYTREGTSKNSYCFGEFCDGLEISNNKFLRFNAIKQVWYIANSHANLCNNVFSPWLTPFYYICYSDALSTINTSGNIFETKNGVEWTSNESPNYIVGSHMYRPGTNYLVTNGSVCLSPGSYADITFTADGIAGSPYITTDTILPVGTRISLTLDDNTYYATVVDNNNNNVIMLSIPLPYTNTYNCKVMPPEFQAEFLSARETNNTFTTIDKAAKSFSAFSFGNITVSSGDHAGQYFSIKSGSRILMIGYSAAYIVEIYNGEITNVKTWDLTNYPVDNFK